MSKANTKKRVWSFEGTALLVFTLIFIAVVGSAWMAAFNLRDTIHASNAVTQVDLRALIEVERLRTLAESQIGNSRSFFLLGSGTLFDAQKKDKQMFEESLSNFEKNFSLPQVPEIIKNIQSLEAQQQDIFDQAAKFREQHTESKIVGQFYQSKVVPIRTKINQSLDEIVKLHNAELDRVRGRAKEAALGAEVQVPKGMTWFTGSIGLLFFGMMLLVIKLLFARRRQMAERHRLYEEAKKAIQARDEVLVAVSQDLKDPLNEISQIADSMTASQDVGSVSEKATLIKNSIAITEGLIKDINDQAKSDQGSLTLRLDQLSIDVILDDARLMLQPVAKQRDIRLQFDSVNPPVLAFFDRERVMRVLSNLVGNAIKFSPKHSKVVIKVRSDQQFVYISVADSGPGIPENQLAEIFDHFWQARATADQGAGVGLAIVKTIIEAHGGTVRVDSQGQGSTFTFSLPRRRPVGAQLGKPAATVKQSPSTSTLRSQQSSSSDSPEAPATQV